MSQQVRVDRDLIFTGVASHTPNIKGRPMFEQVVLRDDFVGDALADEWAVDPDTGCNSIIAADIGGVCLSTITANAEDWVTLASELNWKATKNCGMETRLKVNTITNIKIEAGFCDAKTKTGGIATCNAALATLACAADDCAILTLDCDANASNWYMMGNKAASGDQSTILTSTITANTYDTLRVELDSVGTARFFIDGVVVGVLVNCVTNTDPLTPWISLIATGEVARKLSIDYVYCWQDR